MAHTDTDNCCQICGNEFTETFPCCCDYATNEDGTHVDGYCASCCPCNMHRPQIWDGKSAGGGFYQRGE